MAEIADSPGPPAPADPSQPSPQPARRSTGSVAAWLALLCALVALAGLFWAWREDQRLAERIATAAANPAAVDPARVAALDDALGTIRQRLDRLEQRPTPVPVDLAPLEARITRLEQRQTPAPADLDRSKHASRAWSSVRPRKPRHRPICGNWSNGWQTWNSTRPNRPHP